MKYSNKKVSQALSILLFLCLIFPGISEAAAYRVRSGDCLWTIASRNHTTVSKLLSINHLPNYNLRVGQLLNVPDQSYNKPASVATRVPSRGNYSGVISTAERYLGVHYVYGGVNPKGFDCSGFTQYVFGLNGIKLPRVAAEQARVGYNVSNLLPGDLVFFGVPKTGYITHVGIYIGNNSLINASNSGVSIDSMGESWYHSKYVCARRVL